jgi:sterol desaturase/sphingolipid hydroxylase (fatty acid hydroxylase superfamily)
VTRKWSDALRILFPDMPPESILLIKKIAPAVFLAVLWLWETRRPFMKQGERWRHAGQNLAIAILNTTILALTVGAATVAVAEWTAHHGYGVLAQISMSAPLKLVAALVLLDAWMYWWHRANHVFPVLWRFHRMHHSDTAMDVTTATRFHLGEHLGSAVLRVGLIPLLGWEVWHLVIYDTLVVALTQFHHANISLGRWDRPLRLFIVTPDMHKMHHSNHRPETDSNYSTILSMWDRIAGTFTMRKNLRTLVFGLSEFSDPKWQKWRGLWKTPFVSVKRNSAKNDG